jgi:NADPH-dependent glutamate synthase beta subunit-like oxidoreductase/Fe-S oxidoreductase
MLMMTLERYVRYKEYLHFEEGFGIDREVPRCISACPAGCDVQGYVKQIEWGRYEEAYLLIKEKIPFPASIGRICHHPCEANCKRAFFDEPIAIATLKRFVGDHASEKRSAEKPLMEERKAKAKKIAIIGAGPAGLTAAYRLARNGYAVKVFEKLPVEGGMLFAGIPAYRLSKEVLKREIDDVKGTGIAIETGVEIDANKFEELRREYDAVFIAVGAHVSRKLEIEGEDLDGVVHGVDFLRDFNLGIIHEAGKKVVVVGGGNVAIDAARSAIRLGSDVTIVYRRSREEMPAREEEIKEAEEESVKFMFLSNPTRILGTGRVEKMELIQMELGPPDESGRRRPVPIEGSEFLIDVDIVIPAIGQASDLRFLEGSGIETIKGRALKVAEFGITPEEGIFAGGDCVRGAAFAVDAIADGNEAAESIDRFLRGEDFKRGRTSLKIPEEQPEEVEYIKEGLEEERGILSKKRRKETARIGMEERIKSFEEINLGFSEDAAVDETERCFKCRSCLLTFPTVTVETEEREEIDAYGFMDGLTYATGVNKCAECGECTASCPVTAIDPGFSPRRLSGKALMEDADKLALSEEIWLCTTCGICNAICPYGVDFLSFIQGVRSLALSKNSVPHFFEGGLLATEEIGADASDSDRLKWLEGEGSGEELKVSGKGDVYYFTGCLSYLDRVYSDGKNLRLLEIARSAVKILNSIGIVPAVSKEEKCCGHDLLWTGDEKRFKELMKANMDVIRESGAKTVVFTCAECLRTFDIDYRRFSGDLGFEVMHISELLKDKELKFVNKSEEIITYHDPCRLRHLDSYDAPRAVFKRIPGVKIKEMVHNKERATCCGVSALLTCGPVAREMQIERLTEAKQTKASKLVVACPKCWIHLDCAYASNPELGKDKIQIEDWTMTVASRLDSNVRKV